MKTPTWSRTTTVLTTADLGEFDIFAMERLSEDKINPIVAMYILSKDRSLGMIKFNSERRAMTLRQILSNQCEDARQVAVNIIDKMIAEK